MGHSGCSNSGCGNSDCFDHCDRVKIVLRNGCCIRGRFMGCCEVCDRHTKYMIIKGSACRCFYVNPDQVLFITPCEC